MKRTLLLLLALLPLFSCQPEKPEKTPQKDVAFIAIQSFPSKAQIGTNLLPAWSEGDKVGIRSESVEEPAEFVLVSGAGYTTAAFEGWKPEGERFIAFFPSTAKCDGITFRGVLDTKVGHAVPDHPLGALPMWGTSRDLTKLKLTALFGILRLNLKGDVKLQSLMLDAGVPVSGQFLCTLESGTVAMIGGANIIMMDVAGTELLATKDTPFYFILPPGEYDSIKFTVTDVAGDISFLYFDDVEIKAGRYTLVSETLE